MANEPTVFVVDDDPGALQSLCWLIQQAHLHVRGFCSGREFLDSYRCPDPGCLVLDVRMPEMGGLEIQQRLSEDGIGLPIIFITAHGDVPTCAQALTSGALDFLEKPVNAEVFVDRIRKALARGVEQSERQKSAAEIAARMSRLTRREKDVMDMLVSGKTLKEIAAVNSVRIETIWKQRVSLFKKMKVESDVELVHLVTEWANEQRR